MALGKRSPQLNMFEPQFWWHDMLPQDSFYARVAQYRSWLVSDTELSDLYKSETRGKVSIPPSLVCLVLLLMYYDDVSDREAVERMQYDLRWKLALGVPLDWPGFDRTVLVKFRARVIRAGKERLIFDRTVRVARQAGLVARGERQLLDSTNTIGQAAVMDTYTLLRTAIRKVLRASGLGTKTAPGQPHSNLAPYLENTKPQLNWHDAVARQQHLQQLVTDSQTVLALARAKLGEHSSLGEGSAEESEPTSELATSVALLEKILADDVELAQSPPASRPDGVASEAEAGLASVKLREGSAKDRLISTRDLSLRHGRKGASKSWKGHKIQIALAPQEELITNVALSGATSHDSEGAVAILTEQAAAQRGGLNPKLVKTDGAYGTADSRVAFKAAGIEVEAWLGENTNGAGFSKSDFKLNLEGEGGNGRVECPAGKVTSHWNKGRDPQGRSIKVFEFKATDCAICPLASKCRGGNAARRGEAKRERGRMITLHYHEALLQTVRTEQADPILGPAKRERLRERAKIERKIAEVTEQGLRQERYLGEGGRGLQAFFTCGVVNLKRLFKRGKEVMMIGERLVRAFEKDQKLWGGVCPKG